MLPFLINKMAYPEQTDWCLFMGWPVISVVENKVFNFDNLGVGVYSDCSNAVKKKLKL